MAGGVSNLIDMLFRDGIVDIFSIQSFHFNSADAMILTSFLYILTTVSVGAIQD